MKTPTCRSRRAFTLIELLVVIAIIGVLASLLFPAFSAALRKARMANCINNMGQVNKHVQVYLADHGQFFPDASRHPGWTPHALTLGGMGAVGLPDATRPLYKYLPDSEVFECTSDRGSDGGIAGETDSVFQKWGSSYVYALNDDPLSGIAGVGGKKRTHPMFKYSSRKVLFYEPTLQATPGEELSNRDQWHDTSRRASVVSFINGGTVKVLSNGFTEPPASVDQVVAEARPYYRTTF